MKFSCEKETLLNLLNIASRAVTGKSSMPLLEGLLLAADADTLTITGYDLSMGIRTTAQVDVVEPGRIVLNSRLFCEIVRKLPQDVVYPVSYTHLVRAARQRSSNRSHCRTCPSVCRKPASARVLP